MKNLISNKNKVIIHFITSITDHGAQKNLILFIKKIKTKGFTKHVIISIKKPNKYSNVYHELKKLAIPIYQLKIRSLFLNKDILKYSNKEKEIIFFGWMYHGMLIAFIMSKFYGFSSQLIWTIRHGEPFHKGINIITRIIIITLSLINKYQAVEATFKKAEYFVNVSYDALAIFPDTVDKRILQNLTSFSLNRSF